MTIILGKNTKGMVRRLAQATNSLLRITLALLLAFSGTIYAAGNDPDHHKAESLSAKAAIAKYQQRISRLQQEIERTRQELELLHAQRDAASTSSLERADSYQSALNRFERNRRRLAQSEFADSEARLQHARFELFLAERQYNRTQNELRTIETMIDDKTLYLTDRQDLLKRNQQGLVWQQQIVRKLQERLVVARQFASTS